MRLITLNGNDLTLEKVRQIAYLDEDCSIDPDCKINMAKSQKTVRDFVKKEQAIYGVTTGFGALANVHIQSSKSLELQKNIILSHAAGVGDPLPKEIVKTMMLLRVNSLIKGYSGIRYSTVNQLVKMINNNIIPLVPGQGSVGASGDLAPLAHIAMAMMGQGKVDYNGSVEAAADILKKHDIPPLIPIQKEGLALLNGTQMMSAVLSQVLLRAYNSLEWVIVSASMSIDALRASTVPFDPRIHSLRPHPGQQYVSKEVLDFIEGSTIRESHKNCGKVQDAYSIRAIPQVYGAVKDNLDYIKTVLEREYNSVTDNPIIVDGEALSGGNFHGEPLAITSDLAAIAIAEMSSITERRIDRLVNPLVSSLPPFLARGEEGINSGYMIWQYTSASLASENKSLSHPASVDSIPTSAFQEDHVSMGSIASRKALEVVKNCEKVIAIEIMLSYRGIEYLKPLETGFRLKEVLKRIAPTQSRFDGDRYFGQDFDNILNLIKRNGPENYIH